MKTIKVNDEYVNRSIIRCVVICIADFLMNYFLGEAFSWSWFFGGAIFGMSVIDIILALTIKYAKEAENEEKNE